MRVPTILIRTAATLMLMVVTANSGTRANEIMKSQEQTVEQTTELTTELTAQQTTSQIAEETAGQTVEQTAHEQTEVRTLPSSTANLLNDLTRRIAAIEPTEEEDTWRTVPWRIDLMAARVEAARENKPIFLWLMNGHPMGCT